MDLALLDYGTGNLHSLAKALQTAGASVRIEADPGAAARGDAVVLPGAGAFGVAAARLAPGMPVLKQALGAGLPCLGICLGMQLLFEGSEESEGAGLGLLAGKAHRLHTRRVPHMGWNDVEPVGGEALLEQGPFTAYFANSYAIRAADPELVIAWTRYDGFRFPAAVRRDRIWGVQFRPEKSGRAGLRVLADFLSEARRA